MAESVDFNLDIMAPVAPVRITRQNPGPRQERCVSFKCRAIYNTTIHTLRQFIIGMISNYFNIQENSYSMTYTPEINIMGGITEYNFHSYPSSQLSIYEIFNQFQNTDNLTGQETIKICMNNTEHRERIIDVINNPNVARIWYSNMAGMQLLEQLYESRLDEVENTNNNEPNSVGLIERVSTIIPPPIEIGHERVESPLEEERAEHDGECPVCFTERRLHNYYDCIHGMCSECHLNWSSQRYSDRLVDNCPVCRATDGAEIQEAQFPFEDEINDLYDDNSQNINDISQNINDSNSIYIATHIIDRLRDNIERIDYIINNRDRQQLTTIYNTHNFMNDSIDRLESVFDGYPPDLD